VRRVQANGELSQGRTFCFFREEITLIPVGPDFAGVIVCECKNR
jgi:hypothetical protein